MSIPFAQSMQSLQADAGRTSLVGISSAVVLLLLWASWFFTPALAVYTTGELVRLTRSETLVAQFPAQTAIQLRPGQTAQIQPRNPDGSAGMAFPAVVLEVDQQVEHNQIHAILYPETTLDLGDLFAQGVAGTVAVEVETVSPALLLMRVTGLFVETPALSLSPQS